MLAGLAGLVGLQLFLAHFWVDLIDEGYFAELADRVARGELPYRDFDTPYTPAIHYLHAWSYGLFGRDLVSLRLPLIVAKSGLLLLLYLLGRRLMSPAFAALPVLVLIQLDTIPFFWEPHPAWYALALATVAVWSIVRLIESGRDRWILLAGAAVGLACGFKQNIGLFALLATGGFLLFYGADAPRGSARLALPGWTGRPLTWRLLRVACVVATLGAFSWLMRPYLEPHVAAVFLAPLLMLGLFGLRETGRRTATRAELEALAGRLAWFSAATLLLVLVWLTPLLLALGPAGLPLDQFLGRMDLTIFYWPLVEPRPGVFLFLLAAIACPLAIHSLCVPAPVRRRLLGSAAFLIGAALAGDTARVDSALAAGEHAASLSNWRLTLYTAEAVLMYLPSVAFWSGLVATATAAADLTRSAALAARWYLLAGALLLFNLYPRMDTIHVTFSVPVLLVVGSFALARLYRQLTATLDGTTSPRLARGLLFGALLVLPTAAATPNLEWRASSLLDWQDDQPRFGPLDYVSLGLPGADVLVPPNSRDAIGGVAWYLRQRTAPNEPIFAYPTIPLFYYLADRPNPTRYGHLFPGSATEAELGDLIATLERTRTRYVVWDQNWVDEWGAGGKHALNQTLTDYLLGRYHVEAVIGPFHILARTE